MTINTARLTLRNHGGLQHCHHHLLQQETYAIDRTVSYPASALDSNLSHNEWDIFCYQIDLLMKPMLYVTLLLKLCNFFWYGCIIWTLALTCYLLIFEPLVVNPTSFLSQHKSIIPILFLSPYGIYIILYIISRLVWACTAIRVKHCLNKVCQDASKVYSLRGITFTFQSNGNITDPSIENNQWYIIISVNHDNTTTIMIPPSDLLEIPTTWTGSSSADEGAIVSSAAQQRRQDLEAARDLTSFERIR